MTRTDEILSLLRNFGPIGDSTGQSWSDVGFDWCRKAFAKFDEADWSEFETRRNELSNAERSLLADLTLHLPKQPRLSLLIWLVSTSDGETWSSSAHVLGEWVVNDSEAAEACADRLGGDQLVEKFETELSRFVNFPRTTQTFDEYIATYSHLVSEGVIKLYSWLKGLRNKPLQPIGREHAPSG